MSLDPIDQEIRTARSRVRRHRRLLTQRSVVNEQIVQVRQTLTELLHQLDLEERDVAELERPATSSFAAFLATLTGTRQSRLDRERAEAEAARQRVQGQWVRMRQLNADLRSVSEELAGLGDADETYQALLARKERILREYTDDPRIYVLADIGVRLADLVADLREHDEAIAAGREAAREVAALREHLDKARSVLAGTGSVPEFAVFVERGHLDGADQAAWQAQRALDAFARELADVGIFGAKPTLPPVDTGWFADVFFDNMVTDACRHAGVTRTYEQVSEVGVWVSWTVDQLRNRRGALTGERGELVARRDELLTEATGAPMPEDGPRRP